jgi:signal transduction histidine kinase
MHARRVRGLARLGGLTTVRLRTRLLLSHVAVAVAAVGSMLVTMRLLAPSSFGALLNGVASSTPASTLAKQIETTVDHSLTLSFVASLAVGITIAVVVSRLVLRPLDHIRAATHRLAAGHYGEQIAPPRVPELNRLAGDVNQLAAQLADVERRRARLISEVAHEMRTPLTTLRGQLDGLSDGIFAPSDELLASLIDDIDRLHRLASDLSTLSLASESAFVLRPTDTDLTALAWRAADRLRPQFDDADVVLRVDASTPVRAVADTDRVEQVLVNLLGNALAASNPGGTVTVRTAQDHGHAVLTVTDTGIGIAAADLDRVFQRFERVEHAGRPAPASGSGIGLTIARGIAAAHGGGDLTAHSGGIGCGASFQLRIPTLAEALVLPTDAQSTRQNTP